MEIPPSFSLCLAASALPFNLRTTLSLSSFTLPSAPTTRLRKPRVRSFSVERSSAGSKRYATKMFSPLPHRALTRAVDNGFAPFHARLAFIFKPASQCEQQRRRRQQQQRRRQQRRRQQQQQQQHGEAARRIAACTSYQTGHSLPCSTAQTPAPSRS